jgi:putative signal transducing protein
MTIDWLKERKRVRDLYAGMDEGELEKIAGDMAALTEVAREELKSEMARRGLKLPPDKSKSEVKRAGAPPVMVGRYLFLPDAQIAKSILDSAGVDSFLADENLVRMDWLYSNLIGGIKLLVRAEDAEAAKKLLEESPPEEPEAE